MPRHGLSARLLALACAGALGTIVAAGCGDGEEPASPPPLDRPANPPLLPEAQRERLYEAEQRLSRYCRRVALSLTGGARPPDREETRRGFRAADRLVAMVDRRPFHVVQTGVDVRLFVADLVENLEDLRCDERVLSRLEEALR